MIALTYAYFVKMTFLENHETSFNCFNTSMTGALNILPETSTYRIGSHHFRPCSLSHDHTPMYCEYKYPLLNIEIGFLSMFVDWVLALELKFVEHPFLPTKTNNK